MITSTSGDLLSVNAEALVNTVNTVGVMGKGIALQFKKAYPAMYEEYRAAAKSGQIQLGRMHVWPTGQLTNPRFIINFPTKGHWKASSRLADIESGLQDLLNVIDDLQITSIAVPPLGCGNGGLSWAVVKPLIDSAFEQRPDLSVLLFAPDGAPPAAQMTTTTARPNMTPGRAALVTIIDRYTRDFLVEPGLIETQKLTYFLQEAGQPLRLAFRKHLYGPYADNLRHAISAVEGHFLSGFGDGSATVADAEPLRVVKDALGEAREELRADPASYDRVERVMELASGFESAYGLELLATVHWVASHQPAASDREVVEQVREWSARKAELFSERHIMIALRRLRSERWLANEALFA